MLEIQIEGVIDAVLSTGDWVGAGDPLHCTYLGCIGGAVPRRSQLSQVGVVG